MNHYRGFITYLFAVILFVTTTFANLIVSTPKEQQTGVQFQMKASVMKDLNYWLSGQTMKILTILSIHKTGKDNFQLNLMNKQNQPVNINISCTNKDATFDTCVAKKEMPTPTKTL